MSVRTIAFSDLVEEVNRSVDLVDDQEYACAGVRLHGQGAFMRERKLGIEILKKHVQHTVTAGDVVYSTLFAGKGAFAVADRAVEGAIFSEKFPTFRLRDDRLSPRYLAWFFRSGQLSKIAEEQMTGIAAFSLSHLSKKKFLALRVPVPSLERQAEVVKKCDAVVQLKKECERPLRENLDMLSYFTGALTEKLFGEVPRKSFSEIGEYVMRNVRINPDAEYKQVTVAMNNRGLRLRRSCKGSDIQSPGQCSVQSGDILFSRIDLRNGAIGVVGDDLDGAVVTRDFPVFQLFNNTSTARRFLEFVFLAPSFKEQAQDASKGTTGRKKLKREQFLRFQVPWPSPEEQRRIVETVETAYTEVTHLRRNLSEQESLLINLADSVIVSVFTQDAGLQTAQSASQARRVTPRISHF